MRRKNRKQTFLKGRGFVCISTLLLAGSAMQTGCGDTRAQETFGVIDTQQEPLEAIDTQQESEEISIDTVMDEAEMSSSQAASGLGEMGVETEEPAPEADSSASQEILDFVDAFGESYQTIVDPAVLRHDYIRSGFVRNQEQMQYVEAGYTYRQGIDVSYYQGTIDWEKVAEQGYEFAFIRAGFRGYGTEGTLCLDEQLYANLEGAQAAGLDVGVYFFSQAINEAEAVEEAQFVLHALENYQIALPIVYDPESILHTESRTDEVTREQFTKNTLAFCEYVDQAGYEPMVYCNMLWEAFELDMSKVQAYPIWYADYEPCPQTPYQFEIWQYENEGQVEGIAGAVDLNVWLMPQ